MIIDRTFHVAAPATSVWTMLKDLPQVIEHIPGLHVPRAIDAQTHQATINTRVGPTPLTLTLTLTMGSVDDATRTAAFHLTANDAGGSGGVDAMATITVTPAGAGSDIAVHADVELSGVAAQYGSGLLDQAATQGAAGFAANLERALRR